MRQRREGLQWLTLGELKIDPEVQRVHSHGWKDWLAGNWRDEPGFVLNPLVVTDRGGWYSVNKGQHRVLAMNELFPASKRVLCIVRSETTRADEARVFLDDGNTRPTKAFDKFRLRVVAEEENAVAIVHILNKAGLHLSTEMRPKCVSATRALDSIYAKDPTGELLGETLRLAALGFGTEESESFQGLILTGIAYLLRTNPELDRKRLVKKMQTTTPGRLLTAGRGYREAHGGTLPGAIGEHLKLLYNKGLRSGGLA